MAPCRYKKTPSGHDFLEDGAMAVLDAGATAMVGRPARRVCNCNSQYSGTAAGARHAVAP